MLLPRLASTIIRGTSSSRPLARTSSFSRTHCLRMASLGSLILSHVPPEDRPAFFSRLVNSLDPNDKPSVDFVASAIEERADEGTLKILVDFLRRAIEADKLGVPVSLSTRYPRTGGSLFTQSVAILSKAKSTDENVGLSHSSIASHLRFCNSTFPSVPLRSAHAEAVSAALGLLVHPESDICHAARDLVFAVLLHSDEYGAREILALQSPAIWARVQQLTEEHSGKQATVLGYSLWLRWLLFARQSKSDLTQILDGTHWDLILRGLRRGDAEIRKLCLNILKLSLIGVPDEVDETTRLQFERYAIVFETIVLGRYINQIQECESDLDDLSSERSLVGSKWLYTLLACGLDIQMQESNRKFIGNWIMRAGLCSGSEFADFQRDDFLPWATQGSLFVASLKTESNGNAICTHGDRLANYLVGVLKHVRDPMTARQIVWSFVASKKTFPYAKVWLLKAVSEATTSLLHDQARCDTSIDYSDGATNVEVSSEQILRGMPDAARDYVSSKLTVLDMPEPNEASISRRDLLEKDAIAKCTNVDTTDKFDDLWSDLDYLEFPKDLLFHIPAAILNRQLMGKALEDDGLAESVRERIAILQKVAETKTYLVNPLNTALRWAILQTPGLYDLLDIEDYIIRAVDSPPESTIDLMIEEATVHLFAKYEDYFGERPSCGIAALLDLVSRLGDQAQLNGLIERLLQRWKTQKTPPPTVSAWKTTLQLQTLVLCLENVRPPLDQAKTLIMDLLRVLSMEPLPRYRYLLEWAVVRLLQRMKLEDLVLTELASKDHHSNPKYLASLMKLGSILGCSKLSSEEFAATLATLYVPLAASSKIVIRHEAQWQVPILLEHARSRGWTAITDNPALAALDDYIRSLERFSEPPLERQIGRFNPETHHTLTNLVEGAWFGLDSIEGPLTSREDFLKLDAKAIPSDAPVPCMRLGDPISQQAPAAAADDKPVKASAPAPRTVDDVTALQTKGTAYLARTLSDPSTSTTRPNNLIVVGSLVDNPYNLGGLSRVSEIFGASALTLQNQNVIGNKDFTSVSVSSHLHFPIIQLSAPGLPAFLAERKIEGYTVLGIEQTDRSLILGSEEAKLPKKCVLVVGSEKEGIPAVVLTECDILVEIPQKGVTRSLNVQTAVSVVLFEYARQHQSR